MSGPSSPVTAQRTLQILAGALMFTPAFVVVAVSFVLTGDRWAAPELVWLLVVVLVAVLAAVAVPALGYRAEPLEVDPDREAQGRHAVEQLQIGTVRRFAISEAVLMVALAAAFVSTSGGGWLLLVGAVVAEALMARHVWPGEAVVARTEQVLERGGATSWLREALGAPVAGS